MRLFIVSLLALLLYSCSNSKEEQMLYEFQQKNVGSMNFDLKDLDYKVKKIEKVDDITAKDSMGHLKLELAKYWTKNPEQALVDTISFEYVKNVLNKSIAQQDTLHKLYSESVLTAIRLDNYSYEYESKRKRDNALQERTEYQEMILNVKALEQKYDKLAKEPEAILSAKYKAAYSYNNPMLSNARQTFEKHFYTNREQTKFIKQEAINDN